MYRRTLAAALTVIFASPVQADFALTYARDGDACEVEPAAIYVRGAMLRVDTAQGSALYDGVEQFLTFLDHDSRTTFQLELDDDALDLQTDIGTATGHRLDKESARVQEMMEANRGQMQEACRQLERQGMPCPNLGNLDLSRRPADMDMRAMLEQQQQAMANMDPKLLEGTGYDAKSMQADLDAAASDLDARQRLSDAEVIVSGRSENISGVDCSVREWRDAGEIFEQRCEAPWQALGLEAREQRALERAIARMRRFGASMNPLIERFDVPREEDPGTRVILSKTCHQEGRVVGRATARIAREALSPKLFETPADYAPAM